MKIKNIHWLSGLLEGEGCFGLNDNTPYIQLKMNDLDIVKRFHSLVKSTGTIFEEERNHLPNSKSAYISKVYGNTAISWMMTLYSLMGIRRKAKIQEIIAFWKIRKLNTKAVISPKRRLILNYIRLGFTLEEAEKQVNSVLVMNSKE